MLNPSYLAPTGMFPLSFLLREAIFGLQVSHTWSLCLVRCFSIAKKGFAYGDCMGIWILYAPVTILQVALLASPPAEKSQPVEEGRSVEEGYHQDCHNLQTLRVSHVCARFLRCISSERATILRHS